MLTLVKWLWLTLFLYAPALMFWLEFFAWKATH